MLGQLTTDGINALQGSAPFNISAYKIGTGYNYVPQQSDVALHGTTVWTGSTTGPVAANANVVMWGVHLGIAVGPFAYGELGLYFDDGRLFALFANDVLLQKIQQGATSGTPNEVTFQIFVSMVGDNYDIWLDLGTANNNLVVPRALSVDQLPQPKNATPNIYVVPGATNNQQSILAVTDRTSLWSYEGYDYANTTDYTASAATSRTIKVTAAHLEDVSPSYFGDLIVQFSSGQNYGISRYVESAVANGDGTYTIAFQTPLAILPNDGDTFRMYRRNALSLTNAVYPIATASTAGGVKPGNHLTVESDGTLDVTQTGIVTVNGVASDDTGAIQLTGAEVPVSWSQVKNKPGTFAPPVATNTVLGGVKIPSGGLILIDQDGNLTLDSSISGGAGQPVIGLVRPTLVQNAVDVNTLLTTGLYYSNNGASLVNSPGFPTDFCTIEVIPFSAGTSQGKVMQRWTQAGFTAYRVVNAANDAGPWTIIGAPSIATTGATGVVSVGDGLSITSNGVLSTKLLTVNGNGPDANGNIVVDTSSAGGFDPATVGRQNGLPGWMAKDPNPFTPSGDPAADAIAQATSDYRYARTGESQLPLGAMHYIARWDAAANLATATLWNGALRTDKNLTFALGANGVVTITYLGTGSTTGGGTVIPDTQITVDGAGMMFIVGNGGTPSLDGNTSFATGDLVFSINGRWWKLPRSLGNLNNNQVNMLSGFSSGTQAQADSLVNVSNSAFYGVQGAPVANITNVGYTFINSTDTGMFYDGTQLSLARAGSVKLGLTATGASVFGTLSVSGFATFSSKATLNNGADVTGDVTVTGTVSGTEVDSTGNMSAQGSISAQGNVTAVGSLNGASAVVAGEVKGQTLSVTGNTLNLGNGWSITSTATGLSFNLNGTPLAKLDNTGTISAHGDIKAFDF